MTKETMNQIALVERNLTDAQIREKAELFVKSKFLPPAIQTVEQALTIIMTGRELGLGLMESLRSINVIQGKPCLSAQLMLALCQRTGELEDLIVEEKHDFCITTIKRKGKSAYAYTFSMADAKALKLDTKDNWLKQPKTMLRWRSLSGNLRVTFADAICGIYTDDEAEDIISNRVEAEAVIADDAEEKKDEITDSINTGEIHDAASETDLVMSIGASYIQDKRFYYKYVDRNISEIYRDQTPAGDRQGRKFLRMVAEKSSDPAERATLTKFLEIMDRPAK